MHLLLLLALDESKADAKGAKEKALLSAQNKVMYVNFNC
jgi:hypothetical protein